jgi:excisionase family DNA binding protein
MSRSGKAPCLHEPATASLGQLLTMLRHTGTVPLETIPEILGELERVRSTLLIRLFAEGMRDTALASKTDPSTRSEELVTVNEAAALLNFRRGYLYELIRRREFPAIKSGKCIRIQVRDLQEWIRHHREGVDTKDGRGLCSPIPMTTLPLKQSRRSR